MRCTFVFHAHTLSVITLLSDFGTQDASAGAAKGVLLSFMPQVRIVDITHDIPPFSIQQAAYVLSTSFHNFAPGTAHLILVDVFYNAAPRLVACTHNGHLFLAPDNGLLPLALGSYAQEGWFCFELGKSNSFHDWLQAAATTIQLLNSTIPQQAGLPPLQLSISEREEKKSEDTEIKCGILYIDHYGNVVTDMHMTQFEKLNRNNKFSFRFRNVYEANIISNNYNSVPPGEFLCRFNRNGYLELCVNQGNASDLFGIRVSSIYNEIKFVFE